MGETWIYESLTNNASESTIFLCQYFITKHNSISSSNYVAEDSGHHTVNYRQRPVQYAQYLSTSGFTR